MAHWLLKSEPFKYAWDRLVADGRTHWDGVRNHQAALNLKAMAVGDRAFFYHSNEGLAVVGVVEVCALSAPDPTTEDVRWDCVTVKALAPMPKPVTLKEVKANPKLAEMSLVASFRLSVQPVSPAEWKEVCRMGGMDPKTLKAA